MEVTSIIIIKYLVLILLLCYGASATCSKKATVDNKTKTVTFHSLQKHDIRTNLSLTYDAKGLQPLFDLAISFMNTVQPKNFGDVFKDDDLVKLFGSDWTKLIKKYETPIIIAIGVGLLFFLFMPLTGLFFCCCRCCGKCGGDMKQSEKKAAQHCKVASMVFFLFLFTVLMLCGVLFMFVTNDRLHDANNNIVKTFDEALDEAERMADIVIKDIDSLTSDQVPCITNLISDNIADTSLKKKIGEKLRENVQGNVSSVLGNADAINRKINEIFDTLNGVVAKNVSFTKNADKLKEELKSVQNDLTAIATECNKNLTLKNAGVCKPLESMKLEPEMDFNSIPNIAKYLGDMQKVKDLKLEENIQTARDTVNKIPDTVVSRSKSAIDGIKQMLEDTKENIKNTGKNLTDTLQEQVDKVKEKTKSNTIYKEVKNGDYDLYERIRWKVYVGLAALMAFIVFILFCGLSCGSCGYNKQYMPTERSTTSNCGGNFLMAGVGLMFIFSFILMIFCVIWFAVGMHIHVFCREMKNGELVDNLFVKHLNGTFKNASLKELLVNCRKNMAVYQASSYIQENFNISQKLDVNIMKDVNKKINDDIKFNLKGEKILTPKAEQALNDMINSPITNIDFNKFFSILNNSITTRNLTEIIANLSNIATKLKSAPSLATGINQIALNTTRIKDTTVVLLKKDIDDLTGLVKTLEVKISTIKGDSKDILDQLKYSQNYVQDETPVVIKNLVHTFASELIDYVDQGITHVIDQVKNNLARCKPVANIYDGLVNTFFCDNVVQNANGFWLALGWCLLFFIPSIILSVKLAKYFRKMDYSTGMDTIVVDHPPYNDKLPPHSHSAPYSTPGYSHEMRPPPPYTSTQHSNPGYQHV